MFLFYGDIIVITLGNYMEDIAVICANVQEIWFACVCCMVTLVLVGTYEMKIDVSLYDFFKDMILLIVIYWCYNIFVHLPYKLFYLNADWKTWNKYRKNYTRQQFFQVYLLKLSQVNAII